MALYPNDLERKTFSTVRRGFDPAEVRDYLVSIATSIRSDARLADKRTQPSTDVARNDAKAILLAAQETAESIRTEARRQADQIRIEAAQDVEAARLVPSGSISAQPPTSTENADAERRLENKVRQLEALRSEVERLHEESGKAVRAASEERRAAERVRAESIDEISRLRYELNVLQTRAGSAGVVSTGSRVPIPGPLGETSVGAQAPIEPAPSQTITVDDTLSESQPTATEVPKKKPIDTATLSVIDSSAPGSESPLVDAVKSAVGRAMKH